MKRSSVPIALVFLLGAATLAGLAQGRRATASTLTEPAQAALREALAGADGEYAARAEYEAILDKFGPDVLPYAHLIQAEEKHIAALQRQCARFGIAIPEDPYLGTIKAPETLAEAAKAGLLAEEANVKMYEALLKAVQDYPSLVQVFSRLQAASLNHHLPALRAAAENGGSITPGLCPQGRRLGQHPGGGGSPAGPGCPGAGAGCCWRAGAAQPMPPAGRQQGWRGGRP